MRTRTSFKEASMLHAAAAAADAIACIDFVLAQQADCCPFQLGARHASAVAVAASGRAGPGSCFSPWLYSAGASRQGHPPPRAVRGTQGGSAIPVTARRPQGCRGVALPCPPGCSAQRRSRAEWRGGPGRSLDVTHSAWCDGHPGGTSRAHFGGDEARGPHPRDAHGDATARKHFCPTLEHGCVRSSRACCQRLPALPVLDHLRMTTRHATRETEDVGDGTPPQQAHPDAPCRFAGHSSGPQ